MTDHYRTTSSQAIARADDLLAGAESALRHDRAEPAGLLLEAIANYLSALARLFSGDDKLLSDGPSGLDDDGTNCLCECHDPKDPPRKDPA